MYESRSFFVIIRHSKLEDLRTYLLNLLRWQNLVLRLRTIHELDVPVTIIIVALIFWRKDGGIRGAVVSVRHMTQIMDCNENTLCIGSGYMLKDASEFAWENSLSGLEFAIGIPGTPWWCRIYECRCLMGK